MGKDGLVTDTYLPKTFIGTFPESLINQIRTELELAALSEPDACKGYFPKSVDADNRGLPNCQRFERQYPFLSQATHAHSFSYLRLSLIHQKPLYGLHIDANAGSGIATTQEQAQPTRSWRALLNLGDQERRMTYSMQDPANANLLEVDGFLTCIDPDRRFLRTAILEKRQGRVVQGIIFCASKILHGGDDGEEGHFVASYGSEEAI